MPNNMKPSPKAYAALRDYEDVKNHYYEGGDGACTYGSGVKAHESDCTPAERLIKLSPTQINRTLAAKVNEAASAAIETFQIKS